MIKLQKTSKGLFRAKFLGWLPYGNHGDTIMRNKIKDIYGDINIIGIIKKGKLADSYDVVWIYQLKEKEVSHNG